MALVRCMIKVAILIGTYTLTPLPSPPSKYLAGTLTLSNVTNEVPADGEYDVLIGFVSTVVVVFY